MTEESFLLVDTVIPPPYYNHFDLITYAFERHVVESIRYTESTLPADVVNYWLFTETSQQEATKQWNRCSRYHQSGEDRRDYVAFSLLKLDDKRPEPKFYNFVPRKTLPLFQYLLNASNNLAILTHRVDLFSNDRKLKKELKLHGWYLRQIIDFYWFGIVRAWKYTYMCPSLIPCDLLEYLDVYWRSGTHLRETYRRLGYRDRYEVPWHPSLCK